MNLNSYTTNEKEESKLQTHCSSYNGSKIVAISD